MAGVAWLSPCLLAALSVFLTPGQCAFQRIDLQSSDVQCNMSSIYDHFMWGRSMDCDGAINENTDTVWKNTSDDNPSCVCTVDGRNEYWLLNLGKQYNIHRVTIYPENNIKKFCFDGNEDSPPVAVTLTCGTGKVISLGEVLLGRNVYGLCTAIAGDCRDTTDVLDRCEGSENCTITIDKAYSPECGYATILKVSYHCETATRPPTTAATSTSARPDRAGGGAQRTVSGGEKSEEDTGSGGAHTQDGGNFTGPLVGGLLGAGALIGLSILLGAFIIRRRRSRDTSNSADTDGARVMSGNAPVRDVTEGDKPETETPGNESNYAQLEKYEDPDDIRPYSVLQDGGKLPNYLNIQSDKERVLYQNTTLSTASKN